MANTSNIPASSKGILWTGRIIGILCVLFLLFDAGGKLFKESHSVIGTMAMGFPESFVPVLGSILLICLIIHVIPGTAVIGGLLITAYLGGAVVSMVRMGIPYYFPIAFGIIFWVGFYLRDNRVRNML